MSVERKVIAPKVPVRKDVLRNGHKPGLLFQAVDLGHELEVIEVESAKTFGEVDPEDTLGTYLSEIGQIPLINHEKEIQLGRAVQLGAFSEFLLDYFSTQKEKRVEDNTFVEVHLHAEDAMNLLSATGLEDFLTPVFREKDIDPQSKTKQLPDSIAGFFINPDKETDIEPNIKALEKGVQEGELAKRQLIEANLRLVVANARKYAGRGVSLQDLNQDGNIGLFRAVEKFDWSLGYKFSTYATWWIRQALTRSIADSSRTIRLPVHVNERLSKAKQILREYSIENQDEMIGSRKAKEILLQRLNSYGSKDGGRNHITSDMADSILNAIYSGETVSLDATRESEDGNIGPLSSTAVDTNADTEREVIRLVEANDVKEVLNSLPDRLRKILELRFGIGDGKSMTLEEIGKELGVTRERIRQLERHAIHLLMTGGKLNKLNSSGK